MSREDTAKLLGGYATGTLTAEEQRALFEAALQDQELFEALAREQALRDLLGDPAARAQLLMAIDDVPAPWYRRWWRLVPVAVLATAIVVVAVVQLQHNSRTLRPLPMAKLEAPAVASQPAPILPPPPEMARAAPPTLTPFSLPGVAPATPPPPPAPAVRAALAKGTAVGGAAPFLDGPRQNPVFEQNRVAPSGAPADSANSFLGTGSASAGLARIFPPVHGMVTDASGAAVPTALVEVKSVATGNVFRTSTNERGEFSAPGLSGDAYQISASATGFRTATVNGVMPVSGTPAPVNLRLEVGQSAESVEVSTAASPIMAEAPPAPVPEMAGGGGGRAFQAQFGAAAANAAEPPAHPGLHYRMLRRMPGGARVEVAADGNVAAGATVILQVTPDADGYLRITRDNGRVIANRAVRRMQPFETQLPKFDKPARVEFRVSFSRQPLEVKKRDAADGESVTITLNFR